VVDELGHHPDEPLVLFLDRAMPALLARFA